VEEVTKMRLDVKRNEQKEKQEKEEAIYNKQQIDAELIDRKNTCKSLIEWTATYLKVLLKPEKLKEDSAMPQSKKDLIDLYQKCVSRNTCMGILHHQAVGGILCSSETTVLAHTDPNCAVQLNGRMNKEEHTEMQLVSVVPHTYNTV
jgi:hypothetical protein